MGPRQEDSSDVRSRVRRFQNRGAAARAVVWSSVVLLAVACGGDDVGGTAGTAEPEPTATSAPPTTGAAESDAAGTTGTEPSTPSTAPSTTVAGGAGSDAGVSVATVTIGDESHEFRTTGFPAETCDPDFFGGAQVVLAAADEDGQPLAVDGVIAPLSLALIPPDLSEDAPSLELSTPAGVEWIANADSTAVSGSAVDDWSIDGNSITGSATFVSPDGEGPVQGSFEIVCAEE